MEDLQAVNNASLDAIPSLPFEDYDNRFGELARFEGSAYLFYERSSRPSSVPPPAGRTRPHDVCRINEKHCSILIVSAGGGRGGINR
jgi:hypothetical protein